MEDRKNGIEKQIGDLQDKLKSKFNELKNLYKENMCYRDFIRNEKLDEKYDKFRIEFYKNRSWKE